MNGVLRITDHPGITQAVYCGPKAMNQSSKIFIFVIIYVIYGKECDKFSYVFFN